MNLPASGTCLRNVTPSFPPRSSWNSFSSEGVGACRIELARCWRVSNRCRERRMWTSAPEVSGRAAALHGAASVTGARASRWYRLAPGAEGAPQGKARPLAEGAQRWRRWSRRRWNRQSPSPGAGHPRSGWLVVSPPATRRPRLCGAEHGFGGDRRRAGALRRAPARAGHPQATITTTS